MYACALQEAKTQTQAMTKSPVVSSQVQVKSKDEAPVIKNNLAEPEYDFLSKQPTEIVDETYKVDKFEKRKKIHENFYTILYYTNIILYYTIYKYLYYTIEVSRVIIIIILFEALKIKACELELEFFDFFLFLILIFFMVFSNNIITRKCGKQNYEKVFRDFQAIEQ